MDLVPTHSPVSPLLDGSVCPVGLGWVGAGGWVGISHLFASRLGVWGGVKVE